MENWLENRMGEVCCFFLGGNSLVVNAPCTNGCCIGLRGRGGKKKNECQDCDGGTKYEAILTEI